MTEYKTFISSPGDVGRERHLAEHAEVFISATSRDLGSYRREIRDALLTLKIFPIEQTNFALAAGPLTQRLRELIEPCNAVIHLAGLYYGAEPPQRLPEQPRRSYTQLEYDVARELGKPVYLFFAAEGCAFDALPEEGEEERALQRAHRRAIEQCGDLYYPFTTREELRSRVRELRLPARSAGAPRRPTNLPYASLGPLFKGRDGTMVQLRQLFASGPCQAIHGLGGAGKTRLAIEYAWRHAGDYTALLFASAPSAVGLRTNLAGFCDPLVLNLPERGQPEEAARLAAVLRWLGTNPGWLLILDNADTQEAAAEVEEMLPELRGGEVLITSRLKDWSPAVQTADPLDALEEAEAAAFLLARTASKRRETLADPQDAAAVARDLGGLALALEQAGAYVAKNGLSFSQYRQRWEARKAEVLAWHDRRLMKYPSSVAVTWQTTVEQLGVAERALLNALAWLAPEPVPVSVLENWSVEGAEPTDALAELASWSLARWTADKDAFTIHRLVQEITRRGLSEEEKTSSLQSVLAQMEANLPRPEWNEAGWRLWEMLAPHVRVLLDHLQGTPIEVTAMGIMNR